MGGWCVAGTDPDRWAQDLATGRQDGAQVALGLHPWAVGRCTPREALDRLEALPRPDALGEIGLDRLRPGFEDRQPAALRAQLAWARERALPVVLHCVRAHGELLALLREVGVPDAGGMVHGWTADAPALRPFLALGLRVGFGEAVHRSRRALRAAVATPADRLLLESDRPEPARIVAHAARIAQARGETPDALLARAGATARALYGVAR